MAVASAMQDADRAIPNRPRPAFGNPDLPPEGRLNTEGNPESLRSEEVSLADWFGHVPPELLMQHFNLSREDLKKFPKDRRGITPVR
jgi:hypothetical protein